MDRCVPPTPAVVAPPGPTAADRVIVPDCPTEVHPDQFRQDWPLEPEERALVVNWLATMSVRGATYDDGQLVRPRHALRAMTTMTALGRLALEQKQLDRLGQLEEGRRFCLNDHVTDAVDLGGRLMTEEAHRRGLSCPARGARRGDAAGHRPGGGGGGRRRGGRLGPGRAGRRRRRRRRATRGCGRTG